MDARETILRLSDRGITVRVFKRKGVSTLQLEVEQKRLGQRALTERKSFRHADEAAAKADASQIFANLLKHAPAARDPAAPLSLEAVVEKYLASAAYAATKQRTADERKRVLEFMLGFEEWRVLPAGQLDQEAVLRYFQARVRGTFRKREITETVSPRRAQAELQMLRTALNWAYTTRVQGRRLVSERVFDDITIPAGGTPSQPSVKADDFVALWLIRDQLHPAFGVALALAYAYGKRGESIRHLRWDEVDWTAQTVFWNPEHDKEEESGTFWIPDDVLEVLKAWQRHRERPKHSPWVFAAPHNADVPIMRTSFYQWIKQAYRKAGLTKPQQGGWHSFRRWFVTRNSGADSKAAMRLAGMRNVSTFHRYQQPDEEAVRRVLLNRQLLTNFLTPVTNNTADSVSAGKSVS